MDDLDIHDHVVEKLQNSKGQWSEIADASGVPKRTLEKIARREFKNPGVKHIESLAKYFRDHPAV